MFLRSATVLFSCFFSASALAATAPQTAASPGSGERWPDGAPLIVVTAMRVDIPLDEVPSTITVLDKKAIDRAQDISISDLLLRTPGISVVRNGGYGTSTSLRVRAAEPGQTVVVIDGVKLNDPSSSDSSYNFANLLTGDISRIEVMRGPQSILWGSQAIGGVVNIITPFPKKPLEASLDIEAGSRQTISARTALGGRTGPLRWRIAGQTFTTGGISALAPAFGGKEADSYSNQSVQGRVEVILNNYATLDFRGHYSSAKSDFDDVGSDAPNTGTNREFVGYAGIKLNLLDGRFRNRFGFGYTDTARKNYDPRRARDLTFDANGRNQRFEYQGSFAFTDNVSALFGAEKESSRFKSVSPAGSLAVPIPEPARGKAEITSIYGQLSARPLNGLTLTAGIRHDNHLTYGGKTLFATGAVWALPTGTTLRTSYGEGFKAPTLYQLFTEYGNTALKPEEAKGWETGAEQSLFNDHLKIGATWFKRTTTQQIVYNSCASAPTSPECYQPGTTIQRSGYYANVSRTKAHGIEAVAALTLGGFTLDGNYTWTVAEDRSAGSINFGNWLSRRPRQMANGSVNYHLPFGLDLGAAVRWSGKTYDDAANTRRLAPYALVDLRAEYALTPELRVFARAENVFNKAYMTAYRYGTLGRSIYAGLRGRF